MNKLINYLNSTIQVKRVYIVSLGVFLIANAAFALTGCTSSADRMYQCEAQGISRDACYMAEQNRKATINAAAQKQAMENATKAVE